MIRPLSPWGALLSLVGLLRPAAASVCALTDLDASNPPKSPPFSADLDRAGILQVAITDPGAEDSSLRSPPMADPPPRSPLPDGARWLHAEVIGWLLVPAGWTPERVAVGVDGSWALRMRGPAGGVLAAYDSSACAGCAVAAGNGWFAELTAQAAEFGLTPCTGFSPKPEALARHPGHVRFAYRAGAGNRHDAVLISAQPPADTHLRSLVVTGVAAPLRDALLEDVVTGASGDL